nr:proton-coupled folate transporter-like [Maniola hyperantus]
MDRENLKDSAGNAEEQQPLKIQSKIVIKNMTCWEKFQYVRSNITVEPVVGFFVFPSILSMLATQNLNLDKACRVNLQFGEAVCNNLRLRKRDNLTLEEDEVQKLVASVQAWKSVILTIVPTILMLFIGAWSDKTGRRKICMLMPIFGDFMACVLNMINTYFFYEVPVEMTGFMEVIFPSLTGSWYTLLLGCFSYLSDITSKETRTFRIGILSLCMTVGFPIAMGLSGVLLRYTGYYGVFSVSALFQFLNFCYVTFAIKDHTWLDCKEKKKKKRCIGFLMEFFDFRSLKDTFHIAFKKGANNRRLRICLIMTVVCLSFGPLWGELSVMYIFARYRFNWDEVKYSIFSTYNLVAHALGTVFSISVFSKKLRVDDAVLGMISATSKIAGSVLLAFARTNAEVYLVPIVQILDGTMTIALRSIASKLVSHQELGKVFSLIGLAETMMPLMFAPLYARVYILTLHTLPGAVFLLTAGATIPCLGIYIWFFRQHKEDARKKKLNVSSNPTVATDFDGAT